MSDESKRKEDHLASSWEQQCIDEVESGTDLEQQAALERGIEDQKMWTLFQNAATNISQLYKGMRCFGRFTLNFPYLMDKLVDFVA